WKLARLDRIEVAMFAVLESPDDSATMEAIMAQAFMEKDTAMGFARLDRYRASLERTYLRCARELRAARKEQNEADSTQMAEKKFEDIFERSLQGPLPGYIFEPKSAPAGQNSAPA